MDNYILFDLARKLYPELKFYGAIAGLMWSFFKIVAWVKALKENDLHHIQQGVTELDGTIKEQTRQITDELKELRADLRSFTSALIVPPRK